MLETIEENTEYYTKPAMQMQTHTKKRVNTSIILTRYLYIKDEVKYAILVSILEKQQEQALFFAFEMYYSGFQEELFEWFWEIYYGFFAVLNPKYEVYMLKQQKNIEEEKRHLLVYAFVKNLLIRGYTTDVFFLCKYIEEEEIKNGSSSGILPKIDTTTGSYKLDCVGIAKYISAIQKPMSANCMTIILHNYILPGDKICNAFSSALETMCIELRPKLLLAHIVRLYYNYNNLHTSTENIYKKDRFVFPPQESIYSLNLEENIEPYNLLKAVTEYSIPTILTGWTRFFCLDRNELSRTELEYIYYNDWLYYAYRSPIWEERIVSYGENGYNILITEEEDEEEDDDEEEKEGLEGNLGSPVEELNGVEEGLEGNLGSPEIIQDFYLKYGLEPDEQPKYVANARIGEIIMEESIVKVFDKWEKCSKDNIIII